MLNMRILLANEPRAYREVIAAAFQALRPNHEVISVSPDDLDAEVERLDPEFVLCSQLTPAVQQHPRSWVVLYPDGQTQAVICVDGQRTTAGDVEFDQLLAIIDQTEGLSTKH